jgi:hypothetical protein
VNATLHGDAVANLVQGRERLVIDVGRAQCVFRSRAVLQEIQRSALTIRFVATSRFQALARRKFNQLKRIYIDVFRAPLGSFMVKQGFLIINHSI